MGGSWGWKAVARLYYVVHVETNGGQHRPVLHLVGIHRSPHNEKPKKVAAAEVGRNLFGWAAEADLLMHPWSHVHKLRSRPALATVGAQGISLRMRQWKLKILAKNLRVLLAHGLR